MPIPTSFTDLSTTPSSNSPGGGESPSDGDNHVRQIYAFLRSIMSNSGNGWTSPYAPTSTTTSGTYTPTYTGVSNVSASSPALHQWLRVGNTVTVSGGGTIDPTNNAAATILGISLPVASNFSAASNCAGVAYGYNGSSEGQQAGISADTTNDRAELSFVELASGANNTWTYSFTYTII